MSIVVALKSLLGPQLYRMHRTNNSSGQTYTPNTAESVGESVIKWIRVGWSLSCWTSPLLLTFLYRRGVFTREGLPYMTFYLAGIGIVYILAVFVRAFGRLLNHDYVTFMHVLTAAQVNSHPDYKKRLAQFDFEFSAWPVDFHCSEAVGSDRTKYTRPLTTSSTSSQRRSLMDSISSAPCQILAYLAVHSFGRRMLYPGTTALIQALMAPMLTQGRAKLIEENNGVRAKLRADDDNDIDTMFVDRRARQSTTHSNGNTLVICSEGNSGFYEVGCMSTPLDAGYSVLGWNHPGFWGSTGAPLPSQEQNAVNAVMQYAIHRLGFHPDSIILFAWSIGGYAASWAAMSYPDVKHVVLDATFDDILPLAVVKLPSSWRSVVEMAVRQHLNLNNAELLARYRGPLLLIRRTKDEMITTVDASVLSSNRANDLVIKLLTSRYPSVFDESTIPYIREYLSTDPAGQVSMRLRYDVSDNVYTQLTRLHPAWSTRSYPSQLGDGLTEEHKIQLALFLVGKYLEDYDATHCSPLLPIYFHDPWTEPSQ